MSIHLRQGHRALHIGIHAVALFCTLSGAAQGSAGAPHTAAGPKLYLPPGVEKLCTVPFDHYTDRPAQVQDRALECLDSIAKTLRDRPDRKLVLVGVSDSIKDHEERDNAMGRDVEDTTGLHLRYEDLAAYRAVNTKAYLVRWYGIDPARMLATTNEKRQGQDVAFYLVPGDASFTHNYLNTTRSNENPCTNTPCWDSREESLTPQQRTKIAPAAAQAQQK